MMPASDAWALLDQAEMICSPEEIHGVLERLAFIALGQSAGFSLEEIAHMFAPDGQPRIVRQMLAIPGAVWVAHTPDFEIQKGGNEKLLQFAAAESYRWSNPRLGHMLTLILCTPGPIDVIVTPIVELALGLYFTATVFYALSNGIYGTLPFLVAARGTRPRPAAEASRARSARPPG